MGNEREDMSDTVTDRPSVVGLDNPAIEGGELYILSGADSIAFKFESDEQRRARLKWLGESILKLVDAEESTEFRYSAG